MEAIMKNTMRHLMALFIVLSTNAFASAFVIDYKRGGVTTRTTCSCASILQRTKKPNYVYMANRNNGDDNSNSNGNPSNDSIVDKNTSLLNRRLHEMRASILTHEMTLPPNPSLGPIEFVQRILEELRQPDLHMPQSGFRTLIRSSSNKWKKALMQSIGVPMSHLEKGGGHGGGGGTHVHGGNDGNCIREDVLVSSLAAAITRPKNQYQILVQDVDAEDHDREGEGNVTGSTGYSLVFPGEVVDYYDGKCWVESQLRHPKTGQLFAILGWSLIRNQDGAWVIDWIDWQDFRDEFRPGHGREEWMRICG